MKIPFLILTPIFLFSCGGHKNKNSLIKENINGNVKSIFLREDNGRKISYQQILYNEKGNVVESKGDFICRDGEIDNFADQETYFYNEKDNLVEVRRHFDGDGAGNDEYRTASYNYDNNNNLIERIEKYPNGNAEYTTWNYEDGRKIEEVGYEGDKNSKVLSQKTFKYDSKGGCVEMTWKMPSITNTLYKYSYDSKNNCIEESRKEDNNNEPIITKYTYDNYDKYNNWLKEVCFNPDGSIDYVITREIVYSNDFSH